MPGKIKYNYQQRIREEAQFWDERAEMLLSSGRIPLWFDYRRGEDVTDIPLDQLRGAGLRANPILFKIVYGDLIDSIIKEATAQKGYALDLGCGSGWFSLELARCGMKVDGCDIGPKQIEIGRMLSKQSKESSDHFLHGDFGSINYQVVDLNRAVFENEKYEVIVSWGVLHHIQYLDNLLDEIHKSLKPDGKFILYESIGYYGLSRIFPLIFKTIKILSKPLARLTKNSTNKVTTSAFEGISEGEILESIERRFSIQIREFKFLFLPVFISYLRIYKLPPNLSVPLVKFLYVIDNALTKSGIFRGPYVLAIARKR